jgi:hypothetical protein
MYTRLRSMSIRLNNTISRIYECAEYMGISVVTQSKGQDCEIRPPDRTFIQNNGVTSYIVERS